MKLDESEDDDYDVDESNDEGDEDELKDLAKKGEREAKPDEIARRIRTRLGRVRRYSGGVGNSLVVEETPERFKILEQNSEVTYAILHRLCQQVPDLAALESVALKHLLVSIQGLGVTRELRVVFTTYGPRAQKN